MIIDGIEFLLTDLAGLHIRYDFDCWWGVYGYFFLASTVARHLDMASGDEAEKFAYANEEEFEPGELIIIAHPNQDSQVKPFIVFTEAALLRMIMLAKTHRATDLCNYLDYKALPESVLPLARRLNLHRRKEVS